MKRKNQNSHISNEKNIHLQKQVSRFKSKAVANAFNDSQMEEKRAEEPARSAIWLLFYFLLLLCLAGRGQHAASGRVGGGGEAPQNPDGEQQAAAAAGGQRPRAAGQVLHAGAQQAGPGEGVHQPAGGARDGEERAQPGLGDHQRPDGWVSVSSRGLRKAVNTDCCWNQHVCLCKTEMLCCPLYFPLTPVQMCLPHSCGRWNAFRWLRRIF